MRSFPIRHSLHLALLLGVSVPLCGEVSPIPSPTPDAILWAESHKPSWPSSVTLLEDREFPVFIGEKPAGTVHIPAGRELPLLAVGSGSVTVDLGGTGRVLPVSATDLGERIRRSALWSNALAQASATATPVPSPTASMVPTSRVMPTPAPALTAHHDLTDGSLIRPGEIWPDDRGTHVQAHGGGIIKVGDTWYWFGEDRSPDIPRGERAVACYSSKDLVHWQFRNRVLQGTAPDNIGPNWVLERPKVFYNARTRKYVMYMHIDGPNNPSDMKGSNYALARVGVALSDTVDGNYKFVRTFRPLGKESRDIGQFVDDDGTAYLIFESRPTHGFYIAKLSGDYLDVAEETAFVRKPLEGGGLVHYDGLYYLLGSYMTGWDPNPNVYATSRRIEGPWTEFKDIAPKEKKTYGSQSTLLLKVPGTKKTSVIFMGDIWRPRNHPDGRYLWMPLEIGRGNLRLPEPKPWSIDTVTGETEIRP